MASQIDALKNLIVAREALEFASCWVGEDDKRRIAEADGIICRVLADVARATIPTRDVVASA